MRAEHFMVLGAIVVGCAGGNGAPSTSGATAPTSTAVAPTPPTPDPPAATTDEAAKPATSSTAENLKKTLAAFAEAHAYRDAKRAVALYTDDAVLVGPAPAG